MMQVSSLILLPQRLFLIVLLFWLITSLHLNIPSEIQIHVCSYNNYGTFQVTKTAVGCCVLPDCNEAGMKCTYDM